MSSLPAPASRGLAACRAHLAGASGPNLIAIVLGGFLGVMALFLIGPGADGVAAQSFGGVFFGLGQAAQTSLQPVVAFVNPFASPSRRDHVARHASARRRPMHLARRAMCVRLCDGYAFPVGDYYSKADHKRDEDSCAATFPDVKTKLYVLPRGSESLKDAVAADDGAAYSALPAAFSYLRSMEQVAACHGAIVRRAMSPLQDVTLRRGDAVMTSQGFRIFQGGHSFPHRPNDFVSLAQWGGLKPHARNELLALENASVDHRLRGAVHLVLAPHSTRRVALAHRIHQPRHLVQLQAVPSFEALN